jgi:multicomponent K+:H+ antiporter subunit G
VNTVAIAEIAVALLLVASGVVALVASVGLLRLPDFFSRMHAPALTSTLASWTVALASIVHFGARGGGLALQVWVVVIVLSITAPVTTLVLARAALFRRRQAGDRLPPPLLDGAVSRDGPAAAQAAASSNARSP